MDQAPQPMSSRQKWMWLAILVPFGLAWVLIHILPLVLFLLTHM